MPLSRFTNIEEIRSEPGLVRGVLWNQSAIAELDLDEVVVRPEFTPDVEVHIYTPTNETYLAGGPITDFVQRGDKIYIDYVSVFAKYGIKRGFFRVVVNVHYSITGDYEYPTLKVVETSSDGLEVLLKQFSPRANDTRPRTIVQDFLTAYPKAYERDFALNFGENQIFKILNYKRYLDDNVLAVRVSQVLPNELTDLTRVNIVEQLTDSWIDNISLDQLAPSTPISKLRGPNFEIESGYTTITETDFLNWNQLLGTNISTSQKIVDSFFSGSIAGVELGIDYTAFPNYVYYSSAAHRVANFKQKLESIEYYNERLGILNNVSGSSSGSLSVNIANVTKKIDNVVGSFDSFERWLYNEPTASIFTHGLSGSAIAGEGEFFAVTPYPKRIVNSKQVLYHSTASVSDTWYNDLYAAARSYDDNNPHALVKAIPLHIREDANNSEFETFVNMIAHHFDILYTYANSLTRVHVKEEHPKRGIDKDVLVDIARSQGWHLVNGNQASQLWKYKLGTNQSGEYASTGSIFSLSDEMITDEVWRRIVNNLPYILKTRGTERAIKALLNIYGIPQTILSIREYGGPLVGEEWPALTEDRYSYAVLFNSGSSIRYPAVHVSSSIANWGRRLGKNNVVPPQTREFRFRPSYTGSMLLYSQISSSGSPLMHIALEYTRSFSGSNTYGRINTVFARANGSAPVTSSTKWLPLYNGQYWNIRYGWTTPGIHFNTGSNTNTTYNIKVQQSSNFIRGKINFSASINITPNNANHYLVWSHPKDITKNIVHIGGNTGSADTLNVNSYLSHRMKGRVGTFSGSMQEYKEWLEFIDNAAFDDHTFNPTSYVSYLSPSSSYDTLVRHYTLGSELIGVNLNTFKIISSSHPNQAINDFTRANPYSTNATANNFKVPSDTQRGNFIPVEETYYIRGASLGANNPRSEKIRLEDNFLVRRLSPTNTAERSSFDTAPLDSNKLGLFYSFADQVNKDIFNQIGTIDLDDYVGDPDDEHELAYEDLKFFATQYWKKFNNSSDVNSFNRIFSQFDFSVFNQIKQTLPLRVDDVSGLLVEPNILERSKVQLTKPIKVENPQYDIVINQIPPTSSGVVTVPYEALIDNGETTVYTPSATFQEEYIGQTNLIQYTSSMNYCTIQTLPVDELMTYTASIIDSNYFVSKSGAFTYGYVKNYYGNQDVLFDPTSTKSTALWRDISVPIFSKFNWNEKIQTVTSGATISTGTVATGSYADQIRFKLDTYNQYDVHARPEIRFLDTANPFPSAAGYPTLEYTLLLAETETSDINSRITRVLDSQIFQAASNGAGKTVKFKSVLIPAQTHLVVILQMKLPAQTYLVYVGTQVSASITFQPNKAIKADGSQNMPYDTNYTASVANADIVTNAHNINWFIDNLGSSCLMYHNAAPQPFDIDGVDTNETLAAQLLMTNASGSDTWIYLGPTADGNPSINESFNDVADAIAPFTVDITDVFDGSGNFSWESGSFSTSNATSVSQIDFSWFRVYMTIDEVCHTARGAEINEPRTSGIYQKYIYHFSGSPSITNPIARNLAAAQSESLGIYYSRSLAPASYRDDFFETYERAFYTGTQLTATAVNQNSTNAALGNAPIIEIYEVNPNQIFYNSTPRQAGPGNTLDPGNITIR
jgi:hypothetical protein